MENQNELNEKLKKLAEKYEISSFVNEDPSQFIRFFKAQCDIEAGSFIAAMLSFGNRRQFIPKIREIFELAEKSYGKSETPMKDWLISRKFNTDFNSPDGNNLKKFYRFYSWTDMHTLFEEMAELLEKSGSMGKYFSEKCSGSGDRLLLCSEICSAFPESKIVPKGKNSASKRIHMFLRWMVRKNSPVDTGLWNWWKPENLIIPLDTHVLQEAEKFGIIPENSSGSLKTALKITDRMKEIWPEDPVKADFALFGLGVENNPEI